MTSYAHHHKRNGKAVSIGSFQTGLIALIYKMRWDIEKTCDEKKNKLGVIKTWATTPEAKCQQAHFVCMTRNLMQRLRQ
jgi:hypothetical protein